jgi:hypothetical protein
VIVKKEIEPGKYECSNPNCINGIDQNRVYEAAYQMAKDNFDIAVENGYTGQDDEYDFASEHWGYFEDSVDEDECKCHICDGKGYLDWIDNIMKRSN